MANAIINVGQTGGQVNISTAVAPATPAAGYVTLYAGNDKALHALNSDGVDITIAAAGAGATGALQVGSGITSTLQPVKDAVGVTGALKISTLYTTNNGPNNFTNSTIFGQCNLVVNSAEACSTAFGFKVFERLTTGVNNLGIGNCVGTCITTQIGNVAIGDFALQNQRGNFNTGIGVIALQSGSVGNESTAVGYFALGIQNANGGCNTAVGSCSLSRVTSGSFNTSVGTCSLHCVVSGNRNTAIGYNAIFASDSQSDKIAVGSNITSSNSCTISMGNSVTHFPGSTGSIVVGHNAIGGTGSCNSVVVGFCANTAAADTVTIGDAARTTKNCSIAVGNAACSLACNAIAIGQGSWADTPYSNGIAIGSGACINNFFNIGYNNVLYNGADVIGFNNVVNGTSLVVGNSNSGAFVQTIFGLSNIGSGNYNSLFGQGNTLSGECSTAFGFRNCNITSASSCVNMFGFCNSTFPGSTGAAIFGFKSSGGTGAYDSVVIGNSSQTTGACSVVIGQTACTTAINSVAIGSLVCSIATESVTIGNSSRVCTGNQYGIALGYNATSNSFAGVAIGRNVTTSNNGSFALGSGVSANGEYAVAMGTNSTANSGQSFTVGLYADNNGAVSFLHGRYSSISNGERITSISNAGATICGNSLFSVAISALNQTGNICLGDSSVFLGGPIEGAGSIGTTPKSLIGISSAYGKFGNANCGNSLINSAYSCFANSTCYSTVIGVTGFTATQSNTTYVPNLQVLGQAASLAHAVGSTGGTVAIDWNNSNVQTLTLTSSATVSMSNPIDGGVYTLQITQGGSGSNTVTWSNVKWPGGTPPTLSTAVGALDVLTFIYGPTAYVGNANLNFS